MNKQLLPPELRDVEIVDSEGKPLPTHEFQETLSAIMQAASVGQMVKIRKILEDGQSQGWTDFFPLNVTDVFLETRLYKPAQSISLINDGPSQILLAINGRHTTPAVINAGETYQTRFNGHKLFSFYVTCPLGLVSTCRVGVKG